jgi:orotate phosphoribosyltransferase
MSLIQQHSAQLTGVLIALDRQERGQGQLSAIQEVERDFNIQVVSIVSLSDVMHYLEQDSTLNTHLNAVKAYRQTYGI